MSINAPLLQQYLEREFLHHGLVGDQFRGVEQGSRVRARWKARNHRRSVTKLEPIQTHVRAWEVFDGKGTKSDVLKAQMRVGGVRDEESVKIMTRTNQGVLFCDTIGVRK